MAGGGAAPQPKQDELLPHPVKDQLPNVSYCITSPPPWRKLFNFFIEMSFFYTKHDTDTRYNALGSC